MGRSEVREAEREKGCQSYGASGGVAHKNTLSVMAGPLGECNRPRSLRPSMNRILLMRPGFHYRDLSPCFGAAGTKSMNAFIISSQVCSPKRTDFDGSGLRGFFAELS